MSDVSSGGFFANLKIGNKIIALTLVFGLVPAGGLMGILFSQYEPFHVKLSADLAVTARKAIEVVDRNLFERYGDVQAFGLNTAAVSPANHGNRDAGNPLIRAMNGYMTGYGIYKLMVLVDPNGKVLAVNTVDGKGNKSTKDFAMAEGEEYALYTKLGWQTMACVTPIHQFMPDRELLPK